MGAHFAGDDMFLRSWIVALVVLGGSLCPTARVWAEVHGGIEIGAKGIRAIVVDVLGEDDPKILMIDNKNTTLVAELAKAKKYTPMALAETATIVGQLSKKMS